MQRLGKFTLRVVLLAAGAWMVCATTAPGEDLYDPAEAEKYRLKPKPITESILESATTQPTGQSAGGATTAAAGEPDSQPESPFAVTPAGLGARRDLTPGYIELSDGTILPGQIYTTREKPWSVYQEEGKSFRRIPPVVVGQIDAAVVKEWDEPDWRWKENGSDEKIYTGRAYPTRITNYTFTLVDGQKITGMVKQPIYVQPDGGGDPRQFILHERDKGPLDGKLSSLVYVKHVYLGPEALARGKELAGKRTPATRPSGK